LKYGERARTIEAIYFALPLFGQELENPSIAISSNELYLLLSFTISPDIVADWLLGLSRI